jgi:outer membrane protein TolC
MAGGGAKPSHAPLQSADSNAQDSGELVLIGHAPLQVVGEGELFIGQAELDIDQLIAEVHGRNPSLQAAAAAWQAAAERYPQVVSLDDPMFGSMLGPASLGSGEVDFGWMVETSQKLPWPGKRRLRGQQAQAEADAAYQDIEDARLRLAEAARMAFLDYFLAQRHLELNASNVEEVERYRKTALAHYENRLVQQQDVLQAEVELAELERRKLELERMERVAVARINTLLHRVPDHPLPPAPGELPSAAELPSATELRKLALDRRPDLAASSARMRAEEAALELAAKEFYPDIELVARYDAFWQPAERDLRPQVGINLNLPMRRDRRCAAVREAIARLSQRRAEFASRVDQIQEEVQAAADRLEKSRGIVQVYSDKIVPAAELNVRSAVIGYEAPKLDFLRLIEAQRQLIEIREKQYEAIADYHRRLAELERALGGPIPSTGR